MSIFNRAYLYIIRKKVRSSILFLIVTLISFFLLSGSVLNTTVNNISKNLYKDVNFGFNIESVDKSNKEIEKDTLKKIEELKGITTKNYIFSKPVNVEGKKVVQENQNITLNDEIKNNSNLVMLIGITTSKSNIDFKSEVLKLEKGRHIEENDNKIMIHEKFAELNHVNLGDKIKLSQEGKTLELEVVGIYSGEKTNTFNGLSSDFIENTVYTDYKSSQELSNLIDNNKVTSVEYGVEDPTKLDDVIKTVENLGINNLMVSKSNKNYELVTSSVESITKITNMIRIGSVVVGVVILSLILMFWVRERTYEIGILLSLGTSKINLVLQFIVEVLLVTIFGLITALGIEMITIKYLASNVGSIFSEDLPKTMADELMKMSVNGIDIVNLVIVMIAIVIISVVVALLPIIKMKPKKILTNIN